jgi:carboxyvinyl-carboxyphosphonate phosphorylmutase
LFQKGEKNIMTRAGKLRELLAGQKIIMAPGAYDAWSARLIEKAGFPAVYMTGYGVSASVLGRPDIGLISMQEMAEAAKNICNCTTVPVIADADNGYGNSLNVVRTVREYEMAGVAGIQLEDQIMPKRCGHMEGKQIVSVDDMVAKVRGAVYARRNPDTVIIARTDAIAVNGYDDAIERAVAYKNAGADVIFVEAMQTQEQVAQAAHRVGAPLMANMVEHGKTPLELADKLFDMGFRIAIYPVAPLYVATKALTQMLAVLKEKEDLKACASYEVDFPTFNKMIGLDEIRALEKSFTNTNNLKEK